MRAATNLFDQRSRRITIRARAKWVARAELEVIQIGVFQLSLSFFQYGAATLADGGVSLVFADAGGIVPAALAFCAVGFLNFDVHAACTVARALSECDSRDDE